MVIAAALCMLLFGCSTSNKSNPVTTPPQELNAVGQCLKYVLTEQPDYMGGNKQLAVLVLRLRDNNRDHEDCGTIKIDKGKISLSNGESVKITRMKSDFRCPCLSIWVPLFYLSGDDPNNTIVVNHPDTPDSCEELCKGKKKTSN